MDLFEQFAIDEKKEIEGVWVPSGKGSQVLVARYPNKKFEAAFDRMSKPYQGGRRGASLPEDVGEKIFLRAFAEHVLLGWEGITDEGKPVTYSPREAERLLKKYPLFREQVQGYAEKVDLFKKEDAAEVLGNSEPSSAQS
jgi:hypothetical protein